MYRSLDTFIIKVAILKPAAAARLFTSGEQRRRFRTYAQWGTFRIRPFFCQNPALPPPRRRTGNSSVLSGVTFPLFVKRVLYVDIY